MHQHFQDALAALSDTKEIYKTATTLLNILVT
jgi:hypothetical protein